MALSTNRLSLLGIFVGAQGLGTLDPLIKSRWSFVELVAVFPQLAANPGLMHQ